MCFIASHLFFLFLLYSIIHVAPLEDDCSYLLLWSSCLISKQFVLTPVLIISMCMCVCARICVFDLVVLFLSVSASASLTGHAVPAQVSAVASGFEVRESSCQHYVQCESGRLCKSANAAF